MGPIDPLSRTRNNAQYKRTSTWPWFESDADYLLITGTYRPIPFHLLLCHRLDLYRLRARHSPNPITRRKSLLLPSSLRIRWPKSLLSFPLINSLDKIRILCRPVGHCSARSYLCSTHLYPCSSLLTMLGLVCLGYVPPNQLILVWPCPSQLRSTSSTAQR